MRYLVDTSVAIWILSDASQLSKKAARVLGDAGNVLYFSAASYWEICLKLRVGKLKLASGWEKEIEQSLTDGTFTWLPILREHCVLTIDLPAYHKDPFDRLLVAQAKREKLGIVSGDRAFRRYGVATVW